MSENEVSIINGRLATDPKVEPCPFCGHKPWATIVLSDDDTPGKLGIVRCPYCDLIAMTHRQPDTPSFQMLMRAWNKKARAIKWLLGRANLDPKLVEYVVRNFKRRY
jgi:hypothetical protein